MHHHVYVRPAPRQGVKGKGGKSQHQYSSVATIMLRGAGALLMGSVETLLRASATSLVVEAVTLAAEAVTLAAVQGDGLVPASIAGPKDVVLRTVSPAKLHVVARAPRLAICLQLIVVCVNIIALQLIDCI